MQDVCCAAAGSYHSLAIARDGTAHGWGIGADFAGAIPVLGLQLTENQTTPLECNELRLAVP